MYPVSYVGFVIKDYLFNQHVKELSHNLEIVFVSDIQQLPGCLCLRLFECGGWDVGRVPSTFSLSQLKID